jgi:predicted transcriptional regulator of viral defense system
MTLRNLLFQIADSQQGYFTAQQAVECGYLRPHFHRYVASGEWVKAQRGIYRLANYPVTERPELALWSLWSRDRKGNPQGVWSHDTALDVYELSDVMPAKTHMTVPNRFRKRVSIPKVLFLHYADLPKSDFREQQGYRITTPLRTLIDVAEEGRLSTDLIIQAIRDALKKGLVSKNELPPSLQEFLR